MTDRVHSPPGLPVVGSVTQLARDPLRYLAGVQEASGGQYPLVRLDPPGGQTVTVVLDASLVHEILTDRERFARPGTGPDQQRRQGLFTSRGALWEQQRSVLEPEFVGSRLAEYAEIAADTVESMLAEWPTDGRIDLVSELSTMTMRVITRTLFSQDTTREQSRTVEEALSAVALGADAVCLGRPYVYGLAIDGANGVRAVCENFLADMDRTMGLTGRTAVPDIDRSLVVDERRLFRDLETLR